MTDIFSAPPAPVATGGERAFVYRILRYAPNSLRDEWLNIGVLLFDPETGERRLRLIEDEEEYSRVRRLHREANEAVLRTLRDGIEEQFNVNGKGREEMSSREWLNVLAKWDQTLSQALQLAGLQVTRATDLDEELERLYAGRVAVRARARGRVGVPGSRNAIRHYCSQVFKQARLWNLLQKSVRVEEFTFPGDPMRLDYSYRRNGTRGFVHTLSVSRAPRDAKELAYTVQHIASKAAFATEFAAVTDVALAADNPRHRFVRDTLRDVGVEPIPMEGLAVWVAKLRPTLH